MATALKKDNDILKVINKYKTLPSKLHLLDKGDSNKVELMTVESLLDEDVINGFNSKEMLIEYLFKVTQLIKGYKQDGIKAVYEAIKQNN